MNFCRRLLPVDTMFGRFNDVLQSAADVLAPPPTLFQDFEYHWKQVKNFYTNERGLPKTHINDTSVPQHLESMLKILIDEETEYNGLDESITKECLEFVLTNRPLDLFSDLAITDTPPGATVCILNWIRRFLSCLTHPRLEQESIFQPVQKLINLCNGNKASPYENEEILFLLTVSGLIRKEPCLINLFLPSHQHSEFVNVNIIKGKKHLQKIPTKNPLFDCTKVEANIRRISIIHDTDSKVETLAEVVAATTVSDVDENGDKNDNYKDNASCSSSTSNSSNNINSISNNNSNNVPTTSTDLKPTKKKNIICDCDKDDRFYLLDAILSYFESADSVVVVRASESALILASLPSVDVNCNAVRSSLNGFSIKIAYKLVGLCNRIPDDMDTGDIEDCNVSWGLIPRDLDANNFIGRAQLHEFLCWLDYSNCLMKECIEMTNSLCEEIRINLLEKIIEPGLLDITASFMLVLVSKIIRQMTSKKFSDELAIWLIGKHDEEHMGNECLLTIIIENAHDNTDILLPTLQFVESLLENPNERILHGMLFRYINNRGYYDSNIKLVETWSDEEHEREQRRRDSIHGTIKSSKTMAPSNILRIINHFLLLLPRQIMSKSVGPCYEEYVQDASRHYQNWLTKTNGFNWPIEADFHDKSESSPELLSPSTSQNLPCSSMSSKSREDSQLSDSGIFEGHFYEGPLLRLLFVHVRNMSVHPYEFNLAVVAILSKLAFLPHPYLHEILLNPEIPLNHGTHTLWSSMQSLSRLLLLEIPKIEGFQERVAETGKRLLVNPPFINEQNDESDPLFESLVVLEEFCKELAAIAFVKYHHATE